MVQRYYALRRDVGVQFPGENRYITLEWPLINVPKVDNKKQLCVKILENVGLCIIWLNHKIKKLSTSQVVTASHRSCYCHPLDDPR